MKKDKGKQPMREGEQNLKASELGASPSMMLLALNIGSTSSGSPAIASDPPTPAIAPTVPQAQFYIEVPPPMVAYSPPCRH